jgi:ABC-2 type transport system permease protein
MIALIKRELQRNRTSYIIYCLIAVGFIVLYVSLFPSIQEQSAELEKILKAWPKSFLEAFGVDISGYNQIEMYLSSELMSLLWPILAVLLCVSRAGASIAGGIENRSIGLELSLPITRVRLYVAKLIGGLISAVVFCMVSIFMIIPVCAIFSIEVKVDRIAALFLICVLFVKALYSLALLVSSFASEKGRVYFAMGAFVLVSYVGNIVANISDGFSWLKHVSIFYYFDTFGVLKGEFIPVRSWIFFVAVTLFAIIAGSAKFYKRDISV